MTDCPYDPSLDVCKPLGMFHCPLCGEMVVGGFPHPAADVSPSDIAAHRHSELMALLREIKELLVDREREHARYTPDHR